MNVQIFVFTLTGMISILDQFKVIIQTNRILIIGENVEQVIEEMITETNRLNVLFKVLVPLSIEWRGSNLRKEIEKMIIEGESQR